MKLALQTTYRNVARSERLDALIREEVSKLEQLYDRITSCRVLIERSHLHSMGAPFHVRIELGVPGEELVVSRVPHIRATLVGSETHRPSKAHEVDAMHKDAQLAVRDAFRKLERRLREYVRRRTGAVKSHEPPSGGEPLE